MRPSFLLNKKMRYAIIKTDQSLRHFKEDKMKRIAIFILSLAVIFSAVPLNSTAYASQDTDVQPIETAADFFQYV